MFNLEKLMAPAAAEDGIPEIPELKETVNKMREYRDNMEDRLGSYSYALHPWQDRDHGWESQLRVFHFDDGNVRSESPRLDRRNDPQQLWLDIEQALEKKPSENPPRSLILMEGMDARIAEALSVKLGIPHEFWTAHYLTETQLRLINPSGFDSADSTYWKIKAPSINRHIYPHQLSLWDVAVQAYENEKIITTDDPFSATIIIRNFVFWKWEDQITANWDLNQTLWTSSLVETQKALDIKSPNLLIERSRTIAADYQKLRHSRQLLQQAAVLVRRIHEAFRCDDTHYLASQTIERLRIQISQESRRWSHLQDHMKVLDELISGNMTMYAQRAAMDEAFATRIQAYDSYTQTKAANEQAAAANRTARSSGQLAKIATVAVPCTVAASILSMNGDFAAGEPLFYVYWCVAMPLTIVLLGWVVQKDVRAWRDKLVKKAKSEKGEKDVESSRNSGYYSD
ncbi:hypothetical protein FOC4_g10005641 [Fusarium odoratissimum]|uniref:Uncharacterized protein n=1 Tax=Fusarium oxysporum f. sp. cubense (strain race 4) TaxID=2502994 RepID=N1RTL4_FUSC4|nr:hypothetical protein FOC4_g10005641 [Fusarium odoratissimum]